MKWFHSAAEVNWPRASMVVGAAMIFWLGLEQILPSRFHHAGVVFLGSAQAAVTFLMRSRNPNFRSRKTDPPTGAHV